jgi:hypothetical protein
VSIDHKAYLFHYWAFRVELAPILYQALERDAVEDLRAFINRYRQHLTDQGTEEPLGEDWESRLAEAIEKPNVQHYADLALTKYYDLTEPMGLSYGFDALGAYLRTVTEQADRLICGCLFGPKGRRLDPGYMGTGILSPEQVEQVFEMLEKKWPPIPEPESEVYAECHYQPDSAEEVRQSLERLENLYCRAFEEDRGILFVDFNDCGVGRM